MKKIFLPLILHFFSPNLDPGIRIFERIVQAREYIPLIFHLQDFDTGYIEYQASCKVLKSSISFILVTWLHSVVGRAEKMSQLTENLLKSN